jgi:hypothetical protein
MLRTFSEFLSFKAMMLNKGDATVIRDHALAAIKELMTLFHFAQERCSPEQNDQIKRGVGLAIGRIQTGFWMM